MSKWKIQIPKIFNSNEGLVPRDAVAYLREGYLSKGFLCSNAHTIEKHYHYSGSGALSELPSQWRVVSANIAFQMHEEERMNKFIEKLQRLIDEEFDVASSKEVTIDGNNSSSN